MSHTLGAVRFADGAVYFFDYNGTGDVCVPALVKYQGDVKCREMPERTCICESPVHDIVDIYADYGKGSLWQGQACRRCRVLVGDLEAPMEATSASDRPDWFQAATGYPSLREQWGEAW